MACETVPVGFFGDCCDRTPPEPVHCGWTISYQGTDTKPMVPHGANCPWPFIGKVFDGDDLAELEHVWDKAKANHDAAASASLCTDETKWGGGGGLPIGGIAPVIGADVECPSDASGVAILASGGNGGCCTLEYRLPGFDGGFARAT